MTDRDKGGAEEEKKKRLKGGASRDVHTTKVQVSCITSQRTVLQSMLSECIDCNIKNLNHKRTGTEQEKSMKNPMAWQGNHFLYVTTLKSLRMHLSHFSRYCYEVQ